MYFFCVSDESTVVVKDRKQPQRVHVLASLRSLLYRGTECSCFLQGQFILITMKSDIFHASLVNIL